MSININYTIGFAGTGKSYKLIALLNTLPSQQTVVIAPTHKALRRLTQSTDYPQQIEAKTIHSLLGWIPYINENAQHISHIDSTHKLNKDLPDYKHIVIDEAGMMSEDMLMTITSKIDEANNYDDSATDTITLHLFLDPYQLLPVKGQQIQTDPLTTTELITQHRAESLDIVNTYTKFVHYLQHKQRIDLTIPYSEHIVPFDITQFKKGDRLLAFTNEAVGNWNEIIARHLDVHRYEGQEVQLGNKLTTEICDGFIEPDLEELLALYNSKQLVLQNSYINNKFLESSLYALIANKYIKFMRTPQDKVFPVIKGIGKANIVLRKAKEAALNDKSNFKQVYALGRAFVRDYSFASTVHKAQGQEWSTIFIDKKDIQKSIFNNYYENYARLIYVSLSRAINLIFV